MRRLSKKLIIIFIIVLAVSGTLISSCAPNVLRPFPYGKWENAELGLVLAECVNEEKTSEEEVLRVFLDLEYMYTIKDIEVRMATHFGGEFTWYQTYGAHGGELIFDDMNANVKREYGFELHEYIELDSDNFVIISFGRKLRLFYYYPDTIVTMYSPSGEVFARPVFEREYHPNTAFVYRVTPLPQYNFVDSLFTDCERQFNYFNNIPFEIWPRGREFSRNELEEPIHGYIDVQETYLRSLPTGNSKIIRRLSQGDEFTVQGYSDDGESIDGCSRWYFVLTSMESGNRRGYVHSSFITITYSLTS